MKNGKKVWLFISNKTDIYKQTEGKALTKVKRKYLKVGLTVKSWVQGPVLMSYPAQAGAEQIIIVNQ